MSEFQMLDISYGGTVIAVRVRWLPGPGWRGAIRVQDRLVWDTALWCRHCRKLGYDHGSIDAVLEAQRMGVDHAPHITDCAACGACGASTCDACANETGTMCRACYEAGPL